MTNSVQKMLDGNPELKRWSEIMTDLRTAHSAAKDQVDEMVHERLANKSLGRKLQTLHSMLKGDHAAHPAMAAIWPAVQEAALTCLDELAYQLMTEELNNKKDDV